MASRPRRRPVADDRAPTSPQPADDECQDEPREPRGANDREGKERKHQEGRRHERLLPQAQCNARRRNVDGHCRRILHCDQHAEARRGDADDVDGKEHQEDIDHRVTCSDEHIRCEQPSKLRWQRHPHVTDVGWLGVRDHRNADPARDQKRERGEDRASERRRRGEDPACGSPAEPVGDPPSGILIDAVEEVVCGATEANRGDRRPERLEVLR